MKKKPTTNAYNNTLRVDSVRQTHLIASGDLFGRDSALRDALSVNSDVLILLDHSTAHHRGTIERFICSTGKEQYSVNAQCHCLLLDHNEMGFRAFDTVIKVIKKAGLKRKDSVLVYGERALVELVTFCAAVYRRGMVCIPVFDDLEDAKRLFNMKASSTITISNQNSYTVALWARSNFENNYIFSANCSSNEKCESAIPQVHAEHHKATLQVITCANVLDAGSSILTEYIMNRKRVYLVHDPYFGHSAELLEVFLDDCVEMGYVEDAYLEALVVDENSKNLDTVTALIGRMLRQGIGSEDLLIVVGGGVIMDVVGYAASLYCPTGLDYIRVPTTLVGMIDAGVGLKVGVNYATSKNFIGDYYPPLACLVDTVFLNTLPSEELACGLSEAVKIAAVKDRDLFDCIKHHHSDLSNHVDSVEARIIVQHSVGLMLEELEANPIEIDLRRLPDFGHEFGHIIESLSEYRIRHGEAVSIGMAISTHLAMQCGHIDQESYQEFVNLLKGMALPLYDSCCEPDVLWQRIFTDILPHKAGKLHLVIPAGLGEGQFIDELNDLNFSMLEIACHDLAALSGEIATLPCSYELVEPKLAKLDAFN